LDVGKCEEGITMKTFKLFLVILLSFSLTLALLICSGELSAVDIRSGKLSGTQDNSMTINCPSQIPITGTVNAKYNQDGWTDSALGIGNGTASDPQASIFMQELHCYYYICQSGNHDIIVSARITKKIPPRYRCEVSGKAAFVCKPE
jgi:hypothetical protein